MKHTFTPARMIGSSCSNTLRRRWKRSPRAWVQNRTVQSRMADSKMQRRSRIVIGSDDRVFVLTGAGISAESGLATFRGSNGLWEGEPVEEVASPRGWKRDPERVWRFYSQRRKAAAGAAPNPAHLALGVRWSKLWASASFSAHRTLTICMSARAAATWCTCMESSSSPAATVARAKPLPTRASTCAKRSTSAANVEGASVRISSGSAKCHTTWSGSSRSCSAAP